jgi:hypothetical protein
MSWRGVVLLVALFAVLSFAGDYKECVEVEPPPVVENPG